MDNIVYIGLTSKYHNKPYLHYDTKYKMYTLVMNPKTHYRKIKEIMKEVKLVTNIKNIHFNIKNFKECELF